MFAKSAGVIDFNHPVLKLSSLTPEDFFVLLGKIQTVYVYGDEARSLIPEDGQKGFMDHCYQRIGEAYFRTPRTTITSWVNLLSVIEQDPSLDWQQLTGQIEVKKDMGGSADLEVADVDPGMLGISPVSEMMNSPVSNSELPNSFELLDSRIKQWIWASNWPELRDAQARAIPLILDGSDDVIIAATTASGKTEAAFFPSPISTRSALPTRTIQRSSIPPLKALINDQWRRLDELTEKMEIDVTPWHGDIGQQRKERFLKNPKGCLLITPESLEVCFAAAATA